MTEATETQLSEQDLSEGELVEQEPLERVETPPVRLAGYNQVPDFGDSQQNNLKDLSKSPAEI